MVMVEEEVEEVVVVVVVLVVVVVVVVAAAALALTVNGRLSSDSLCESMPIAGPSWPRSAAIPASAATPAWWEAAAAETTDV